MMRSARDPFTYPAAAVTTLHSFARQMREGDAQVAAGALLVAADLVEDLGIPFLVKAKPKLDDAVRGPYSVRDMAAAEDVFANPRFYLDPASSAFRAKVPMRRAADKTDAFADSLRWLAKIARGRFFSSGPKKGVRLNHTRIYKKGRIVARGQNLGAVIRYIRRGGATLVVIEPAPLGMFVQRNPPYRPPSDTGGNVHILFPDGAFTSVAFGSMSVLKDWLARSRWLVGTPIVEWRGPALRSANRYPKT